MKKYLLATLLLLGISIPSSGFNNPSLQYFKSDFSKYTPDRPLGNWTCYGSGKNAQDIYVGDTGNMLSDFFPAGSPAYIPVDFEDFGVVYCSNSTTVEGGAADEWLISPAIDLSGAPENLILAYDVFSFGSDSEPKYEIYVSTTGNRPENFTSKAVYAGKTGNSKTYPVCTREYRSLSGVNAPEVYIAFVNRSRNAQILGFKDITVSEYELEVVNNTPAFLLEPADVPVSVNIGIQTPVKCPGYTVTLSCNGEEQVYSTGKQIGGNYVNATVEFKNPLHIDYGDLLSYSVSLTPNYEGATTSVFNFDMGCTSGYPSVCVEEEGTGTWCGWCVRGIAGLNQFSDEYGDRFIGIAVHADDDPMLVPNYLNPLKQQCGINGYPNAAFNRGCTGDPYERATVESILAANSGYAVRIKEVTFDESNNNLVTVTYAPRIAVSTNFANISAAVVVTEDGVSGSSGKWHQTNYYSGETKAGIEASFGEGAWPYFKKYCEGPAVILSTEMTYDHVAMGIFNSFGGGGEGGTLPAEWIADEEQEFTISFEMPMQTRKNDAGVQNWKNTHMIVLILDNVTGKVLTASKMGADSYTTTGMDDVTIGQEVTVLKEGRDIVVLTESAAKVDVYNLYGISLYSGEADGRSRIDGSRFSGPVVVRVSRGNDSYVKKIIF